MLQKFAGGLTDVLQRNRIVREEDREIYVYGFEAMFSTIINAALIILIGVLAGLLWETIVFLAGFAILRVYCGGYHAKTHLGCILAFLLMYALAMTSVALFPLAYAIPFSIALGACSFLFILKAAPIEHKNRPFVENEFKSFRKMSRVVAALELAAITVISLLFSGSVKYALILSLDMLCVVSILALAKIIERGGSI